MVSVPKHVTHATRKSHHHYNTMAVPSRTLHIDIDNYKTAIEEWTILLERTDSWGTPQCITIEPSATPSVEIEHDMIKLGCSMLENTKSHYYDPGFEDHVLVDFLRKLSSLCDLEWRVDLLLMPSLLQFLRDERPSCMFHLKPFIVSHDAEPAYVRSILSLPSLRTIWFTRKFDGAVEKIVQHMARASDGNVREVRIYWDFPGAAPWGEPLPDMWEEELVAPDGPRGRLQSLQVTGVERVDRAHLEIWARHTDFSQLRTLSLEMRVTRTGLEALINLPLQSLHSLGLDLDWSDTSDHYKTALQTFICTLPRLSHLRLTRDLPPPILQVILDHLEPTLHTISLNPRTAFDSSTITLITDRCTNVRFLSLPIRRAWNKPGEDTALLEAIGLMPHLEHLNLTLDASDRTLLSSSPSGAFLAPSHSSFSAFDNETFPSCFFSGKEVRNGHIRDALINSAIDAPLAKAVFSAILSGAPEGRTPSLRRLSLKSEGGGSFGTSTHNGSISMIADEVGREWVVELSGDGEGLEVRCVGEVNEYLEPGDELNSDVGPVFRSIWPGEGDWWNEWHAFPLI
jgi:hypothetical protein